jgi:DNA-binding protein HU-beta
MAKQLTKSQLASELAQKTGITKKSAEDVLNELATIAYREAENSFTIPGIGKLVVVNRKARMGRNPATGETIQIPAKRALKFRIAKSCSDAVLKNPGD